MVSRNARTPKFLAERSKNTDGQRRITLDRINVHLGGRHVLKDVSWSLEGREHWAFVGVNGSGKSTLLRVIAGTQWIDHDGGTRTYSHDGVRLDAVGRAATWIRFVTAEQHERFARLDLAISGRSLVEGGIDDTVYVATSLEPDSAKRVDALIERLHLGPFADRPLRELSTGQLRRLLIARALVAQPLVLVLDEFTNGLDRAARSDILQLLDEVADSVALIVASHRSADFPRAITETATVRDGRIAGVTAGRPLARGPAETRFPTGLPPLSHRAVLLEFAHADVYRGQTLVLRDLSWQLRQGEHSAIRGPNGAGKTTFAGLIAGTIPAATGAHIMRFGRPGPFNLWKLKERVAHVSDDLQIAYDRGETVEAVIASGFPASIGLFSATTPAQKATVSELIMRFGLESLRGRTFTQLSFGERRKVLIARSLVRQPAILILDEVWNGLDHDFRAALHKMLGNMTLAGTTLVTIAHNEDEDALSLARRVYSIENGVVHEERNDRLQRRPLKSAH